MISILKLHRFKLVKLVLIINDSHIFDIPREEYENHLANRGNRVRIEAQEDSYEAVAKGINNHGELIVEVDGVERIIRTGEVSVRGIYGYV